MFLVKKTQSEARDKVAETEARAVWLVRGGKWLVSRHLLSTAYEMQLREQVSVADDLKQFGLDFWCCLGSV